MKHAYKYGLINTSEYPCVVAASPHTYNTNMDSESFVYLVDAQKEVHMRYVEHYEASWMPPKLCSGKKPGSDRTIELNFLLEVFDFNHYVCKTHPGLIKTLLHRQAVIHNTSTLGLMCVLFEQNRSVSARVVDLYMKVSEKEKEFLLLKELGSSLILKEPDSYTKSDLGRLIAAFENKDEPSMVISDIEFNA